MLKICSLDGCQRKHFGHGFCQKHHWRWKTYGDPDRTKTAGKGELKKWLQEVALTHSSDDCLAWPFCTNGHGYGTLRDDGKNIAAHRWVCAKVHGAAPSNEHEAAHSCGNGHLGCVSPKHLRWATKSENSTDQLIHGTRVRGSKISWSRLTEDQVMAIRGLRGTIPQKQIAELFGISQSRVSDLLLGKSWRWLS